MAGEGLTVLELVDQAVQQCQAVEADADVAVSVATRMSDKAQQKATELEQASTETLEKFEALNGALNQTEQELEALEENRNKLAALGEQVEEVISRVEGLTEEINAELSGVLERLSSLAPGLIEAVPEMQEAVAELMQTAQTQAGEIMQQESATSVRGSEVLLQIQEALGELGELQGKLNEHLSEFGQSLSEGRQEFVEDLNILVQETHEKLLQVGEAASISNDSSPIINLQDSLTDAALQEIDEYCQRLCSTLKDLLKQRENDSEEILHKFIGSVNEINSLLSVLNTIGNMVEAVS